MTGFRAILKTGMGAAVFIISGCAAHNGTILPSQTAVTSALQDSAPRPCEGQTTSSTYATSRPSHLKSQHSHVCIPALSGFGGHLYYPATTPTVPAVLISSVTNYNNLLPILSQGKPIFYLQIATGAATEFASTYSPVGGLVSNKIKPGKTYYVYGLARLNLPSGILLNLTPCRSTAIKVNEGGALTNLGSVLKGQNLFASANIVIEVYTEGQVSTAC